MWFNHPIEEYGPLRGKYSRSGNEIHGIPTVLIRNFCVFKEQLRQLLRQLMPIEDEASEIGQPMPGAESADNCVSGNAV